MIVLGPFTASVGTQQVQTPISTDVTAIGLLNASSFFMTVTSAGTYANMAVPPYTADVFVSPDTASKTLTVTFSNLSSNDPVFAVSTYTTFYVYLYGENDPVSQAVYNGVATGYPYSLSGLHDPSPFRSAILGKFPNNTMKNINVYQVVDNLGYTLDIFDAYIWGFDLTCTRNTTATASDFVTLSDVPNEGDLISWGITGILNADITPLYVRFPFPLPIMGNQVNNPPGFGSYQATFTVPAIGNALMSLNVYTSQ
jgi:hypothetical protein